MARPDDCAGVLMVATTAFVEVSTTEIVSAAWLRT
jgi:hypothetical protein